MLFKTNPAIFAAFNAQFQNEGGMRVYRRYATGPAYAVTVRQETDFRERFEQSQRKLWRGFTVVLIILSLILAAVVMLTDMKSSEGVGRWLIPTVLTPLIIAVIWLSHRITVFPERILSEGLSIAPALDKREARRRALSRITYGQLAMSVAMGVLATLQLSTQFDVWHGTGRLFLALPVTFVALATLQSVRKYRAEGGDR